MRGRFVTFEGGEGAGKSTQITRAAAWLRSRGVEVVVTREPGGTPRAERLRAILLERDDEPMPQACELLLMFAARVTHLDNLVRPAVARGAWVLCDRFTDATYAYQGGGRGLPVAQIDALGGHRPPGPVAGPDAAARPARRRRPRAGRAAQWRRRPRSLRIRAAARSSSACATTYLARARREPRRFRVIDAARPVDDVSADVHAAVEPCWRNSRDGRRSGRRHPDHQPAARVVAVA